MPTDILIGEILEEYSEVIDAKKKKKPKKPKKPGTDPNTQVDCSAADICSVGCVETDGCTTDEKKKKPAKKPVKKSEAWFDPPASRN